MAGEEQFILKYIVDLDDTKNELSGLSQLNSRIAQDITKQLGGAVNILTSSVQNLRREFDKEGNAIGFVGNIGGTFADAQGNINKFKTNFELLGNSFDGISQKATLGNTSISQIAKSFKSASEQVKTFEKDFSGLSLLKKPEALKSLGLSEITKQFGNDFKVLEQNISKVSFQKFTEGTKTVEKPIVTLSTRVRDASGRLGTFKTQMLATAEGIKPLNTTFQEGSTQARTFAANLTSLLKRAILTIPIWFILRNAIIGVPRALREGLDELIKFDESLQKVKRNLIGSASEIEAGFSKIKAEIRRLSLESGKSIEEISNAVKEFATIGFNVEESLAGANASVKASVLFFEDAGKTAKTFARSMKILQDTSADAKSFQQQLNEAFALAVELEKDNVSEIKVLNESLIKIAPAASKAGLSMNETLIILASLGTAGREGSQGATLLRASLNKLVVNLPFLAESFGVVVSEGQSTFDILNNVLDVSEQLAKSGLVQDRVKLEQAFNAIFGGERGSQVIAALTSVNKQLKDNSRVLPNVLKFNEQYNKLITESAKLQKDQLTQGLVELKRAFVDAIVGGGQGLVDLLTNLNKLTKSLTPQLAILGTTINAIFNNLGLIAGVAFLTKFRSLISITAITGIFNKLIPLFSKQGAILGLIFSGTFRRTVVSQLAPNLFAGLSSALGVKLAGRLLGFLLNPIVGIGVVLGSVLGDAITNNLIRKNEENQQKLTNSFSKLVQGLQNKLSDSELAELIVDVKTGNIDTEGANQEQVLLSLERLVIKRKTLEADIAFQKRKQISLDEKLVSLQDEQLSLNAKNRRINRDGINDLVDQIELLERVQGQGIIIDTKQLNDLKKSLIEGLATQEAGINETLLEDLSSRLQAQGALTSQIIKAEQNARKQLGLEVDLNTQISERLATERALTEERRLQNRLSSDSLKLFEIAQQFGVEQARKIGDVLAGNVDFNTFIRRGGEAVDIFKSQFEELFRSKEAEAFFQGRFVSGFQELRGGANIPIQETALQRGVLPSTDTTLLVNQLKAQQEQLKQLQNISVQARIAVDITGLSFDRARDSIVKSIIQELSFQLQNEQSEARQAINNTITEL